MAFFLLGVGGLTILNPYIIAAFHSAIGLAGLGLVALIGVAFFQTVPIIFQKLENWTLKRRILEAQKNPVEQLENYLLRRTEQVAAFREAVTNIGGILRDLKDTLQERVEQKPGYDPKRQEETIQLVRAFYESRLEVLNNAESALLTVKDLVADKRFEWQFGQQAKMAMQVINNKSAKVVLDEMLKDAATDAIRHDVNSAFAALEVEVHMLNRQKMLSAGKESIKLPKINIPELVSI